MISPGHDEAERSHGLSNFTWCLGGRLPLRFITAILDLRSLFVLRSRPMWTDQQDLAFSFKMALRRALSVLRGMSKTLTDGGSTIGRLRRGRQRTVLPI
jgi:hypothetical protein